MSSVPDKEKEKNPNEKPKKVKKRKLWLYRRKVISVDDTFVTFEDQGQIYRWSIDSRSFRNPEYRKWLVDSGYWIPSMDLRERFFTINPEEYTVEDEEEAGGVANEQTESLEERMKKLKAQQQGKFKKYYERKEAREKEKKSKNSKSKVSKSKIEVKKDDGMKKGMDPQKVETPKKEKSKPQEGGVEKIKKVDPPKIEDPKAQTSKKTEDLPLKETVRSHYCYTEMHLVSGK